VSNTDAAKVGALLALSSDQHQWLQDDKCGDSGQITLRLKDGGEVKIGILAGHDPRCYEFRATGAVATASSEWSGFRSLRRWRIWRRRTGPWVARATDKRVRRTSRCT